MCEDRICCGVDMLSVKYECNIQMEISRRLSLDLQFILEVISLEMMWIQGLNPPRED